MNEDCNDVLHIVTNTRYNDSIKKQHLKINLEAKIWHPKIVDIFVQYGFWNVARQEFEDTPNWSSIAQQIRNVKEEVEGGNISQASSYARPTQRIRTEGPGDSGSINAEDDESFSDTDLIPNTSGHDTESDSDVPHESDEDEQPNDFQVADDSEQPGLATTGEESDAKKVLVESLWRESGLPAFCEISQFIEMVDRHILWGSKSRKRVTFDKVAEQVAGGRTQVGKTGFKALLSMIAKQRKVLTVVVTTTLDNRDKLAKDLTDQYFSKIPSEHRPRCETITKSRGDPRMPSEHNKSLQSCMFESGAIIVHCTKGAISKVATKIAELRGRNKRMDFVLVKDESDTMDRTPQRLLHLEKALDVLTGKSKDDFGGRLDSPLLILNISATLLPIFLRIKDEGKAFVEALFGRPNAEEYSGLDNMEPIANKFLVEKELRSNNDPLPFWSDKVQELYADAHPTLESQQGRGVLLLDAVNPRVTAEGNTQDRAEWIQRRYPRFTVVVVWGTGGIKVRFPGGGSWLARPGLDAFIAEEFARGRIRRDGRALQCDLTKLGVSDVLSAIVSRAGVGGPIAVVGYSRMLRGDSFRSSAVHDGGLQLCVVPTHMLCGLGETQSVENLVQMMGRATGAFRRELEANGHSRVKVLTNWRDWDAARAYYEFQDELAGRLRTETLQQALSGIAARYSPAADLRHRGKRPLGNKKLGLELETPFAPGAGGRGLRWAEQSHFPSCGSRGQEFRLESPFTPEMRVAGCWDPEDYALEEHLYHEKHLLAASVDSLVVRRAAAELGLDEVDQERGYWEDLYTGVPHVSFGKDGAPGVKTKSKAWHSAHATGSGPDPGRRWALRGLRLPLFEPSGRGGEGEGRCFKLNERILEFVDTNRDALQRAPPMYTREALERFVRERWPGSAAGGP